MLVSLLVSRHLQHDSYSQRALLAAQNSPGPLPKKKKADSDSSEQTVMKHTMQIYVT
jgi:hypothetical protein